jgi:YD repeat-containing protein
MSSKIKYYFLLLLPALFACRKTPTPPQVIPPVPAIQYPLLSKLTLISQGKTYVEAYTYDTAGTYKNNPILLRSEIAGKVIKLTYAQDVYFRVTVSKVTEYDINTNQLIDAYQYRGYQTEEPEIPPDEKDVTVTDANNNVIKTFSFFKQVVTAPIDYIVNGPDTTHLSFDSNNNLTVFDPGAGMPKVTCTYDDQHHPQSLLEAVNEHLSFAVYPTPQSFVNNPLTITTGGATKTYTYKYNEYGYPISAKVSDGSTITYAYVVRK